MTAKSAQTLAPLPFARPAEPLPMAPPPALRFRTLRVAGTLAVLAFQVRSAGAADDPAELGRQIRSILERLGGIWIQLGQILAIEELLPRETRLQLVDLHDRLGAFPGDVARAIVEAELGARIDEVFAEFDDRPFAAGSFSQSHRAVLRKKKRPVVVKVQRPGIRELVERDLAILDRLARVASLFRSVRPFRLREGVAELRSLVEEELDYRREATNLRRMRPALRGQGIRVPRVWKRWFRERVVVMQRLEGVSLREWLDVAEREPGAAQDWARKNGVRFGRMAERLYQSHLRQMLEDRRFHIDVVPASVVLLPRGRFGLVDFGAVGRMHASVQRKYRRFLQHVAAREYVEATDWLISLLEPIPPVDLNRLAKAILASFRTWDLSIQVPDLPYDQRSIRQIMARVAEVCRRFELAFGWEFLRIDRGFMALDGTLRHVAPELDHHGLLARYFEKEKGRRRWAVLTEMPMPEMSGRGRAPEAIENIGADFARLIRAKSRELDSANTKMTATLLVAATHARWLSLAAGVLLVALFAASRSFLLELPEPGTLLGRVLAWAGRLSGWDWALLSVVCLHVNRTLGKIGRHLATRQNQPAAILK